MFSNYLKTTWRNIARHKGYSFINIAGFALGMACCIVIATYIRLEFSYDGFHKKGDRIFRLVESQSFEGQEGKDLGQSTPWMGETLVEYPEVSKAVNFIDMGTIWTKYNDEMIEIPRALIADPDIFDVFSFKLQQGDPGSALREPYTVVVTESLALRIFSGENPIGKILTGPDSKDYRVTGVAENVPVNSHIQFDMLVSIMEMRSQPIEWDDYDHYSPTYILLELNADPKTLERKLPGHVQHYFRLNADQVALYLQPLKDIHLRSKHIMWEINWHKSDIMYVYFFSIIMVFILLIASINFINLSTARSASRAQEVGIRKVIGANKAQLVRQFMGETLFFTLCSFLSAVVLVSTIKSVLENILSDAVVFNYLDNWIFSAGLLFFLVSVGVLAGIYPAFVLSSFHPAVVLRSAFSQGTRAAGLRKILVMVQFTVSIALIFSTIIVSKQLRYMRNRNTGFDKAQVINLPMTDQMQEHFNAIQADILMNSEIKGVTASTRKLGTPLWRNQIFFEGKKPEEQWISPYIAVDYNFVSFYGIELVAGRDFSPEFADDSSGRSYIINETLAKKIGWENPVGQKFKIGSMNWGKVIGVVKDFNYRSLHHQIEPVAFCIYRPWLFHMSVRIGTGNMSQTLKYLEQKLKPYSPEQPFLYSFLEENYARLYTNEEKSSRIFGIFSLLAIVISCLGLFALVSFTAEQKTKEIGIRKILGSSVLDIIFMLSWRFTKWVILANIIGLPVAWYVMNRWLQNFAYRIQIGMDIFLFASGSALLIALATVAFRVFRAAFANPIDALRYE